MIRYIVQQSSFILRIHLGMSPSTGSVGHLSVLHLSGSPSGRPTCPAQPADTLSMSGVPVLRRWRTPGRVGGAPVAGLVGHGGLLFRSELRLPFHFPIFLSCPNDCYLLFLTICWKFTLGYAKLWYLLRKCLLISPGHFFFCFFLFKIFFDF